MKQGNLRGAGPNCTGIELIEYACLRPRMFFPFPESATYRELIAYVGGICLGKNPPHGSGALGSFAEYFLARTDKKGFWEALDEELQEMEFLEAAAYLALLINNWKTEQDKAR